jgi:hypothetical protein
MLRSTPVSGDWRDDGYGNAEMIAAHAVNSNGFRQPRIRVAASGGQMLAMVASTAPEPESDDEREARMAAEKIESIKAKVRLEALATRRKEHV